MAKKQLLALAGAAALLGALVSGCSPADQAGSQSEEAEQSGAQSGTLDEIFVQEKPEVDRNPTGKLPEITLPTEDAGPKMKAVTADEPDVITVDVLESGDGVEIGPDDFVTVNYAGFLWDGTEFDSSFASNGEPTPLAVSLNQVIQGWKWGLAGTHVGDQVMIIIPPEYGYGDQETARIPAGSTLVFYVDLLETVSVNTEILSEAEETDADLPRGIKVDGNPGEQPVVTFTNNAPMPEEPTTIVLAEGTGPVVTDQDAVEYLMTLGYWGSEERHHTWEDGVGMVEPGSVLVGERVGSRILLVGPAQDQANPATFTIVDILAAHQPR